MEESPIQVPCWGVYKLIKVVTRKDKIIKQEEEFKKKNLGLLVFLDPTTETKKLKGFYD